MMHLFDDTPLPAEQKKPATVVRVVQTTLEGHASSNATRIFGVLNIDGADRLFRVDAEENVADLILAEKGDAIEVGATTFDGDVLFLRSARLVWKEGSPDFHAVMALVNGTNRAKATVLRSKQFEKLNYSKRTTITCVALLIETAHIHGVITITASPEYNNAILSVAAPGDTLDVEFERTTYRDKSYHLKSVKFTSFAQ